MSDDLQQINSVIEYVIEIHANPVDGSQFIRLTAGDDAECAMRLFASLRATGPVYADGGRHDGWMNLIGVTARSPEPTGTLIDQHRWGDE